MASHIKHPRTHQELAAYCEAADYGVKIRAKRNPRNLPNAWDDKPKADHMARTWKHWRETPWKT